MLVLTLDKTLTFNKHIDLSVEKAVKLFAALFPLLNRKSKLSVANKRIVHKASALVYACPVWNGCAVSRNCK